MIRKNIQIGEYTYIIDLYDSKKDNVNVKKEFKIFRHFVLDEGVITDTDIYIIDKDVDIDNILWPMRNNNFSNFSKSPDYYFLIHPMNVDDKKLKEINTFNIELEGSFSAPLINCDKIRVYHPSNKIKINGIIYIDNYINNIHFHYLCKDLKDEPTYCCDEFKYDNLIYCEYIDLYIPNLSELFNEKSNLSIRDILSYNIVEIKDNKILSKHKDILLLHNLIKPFRVVKNGDEYIKEYYNVDENIINCGYPLTISIFPYKNYNENLKFFENDYDYDINSNVFFNDNKFTLASELGFNENGEMSVITRFQYPKEYFKNLSSAYYYHYGKNRIYEDTEDKKTLTENNAERLELLPEEEQEREQIYAIGYKLYIASDAKFKNIVFQKTFNFEDESEIDDFTFSLTNIFQDWQQMPKILLVKTVFIDNYRGIMLSSNSVPITKEYFKYLINDINLYRINLNIDDKKEKNKIIDFKQIIQEIKKEDENMLLIDKINCYVNVKKEDNDNNLQNHFTGTKIIYKPIFFRVNEVKQINLKSNLLQNVGIPLPEFMTKVETFKISIEGNTFVEKGRNEIYVIFPVNSSLLHNVYGSYHILNQDDEYITSGKYIIEQL